jgi:uncharacterized protein DUF4386
MQPTQKTARIAGFLYLLMAIPGPFCLMYVPSVLIVSGNAAATANNIRAHEMLSRLGIVSSLFAGIVFILLAMALYRLFEGVDKTQASLLVILVVVSATIGFLNELNQVGALMLLRGADFLSIFDKQQLEAFAMLFLRLHRQGITIDEIFWGLWLLPFGWLVMKSGFLPRILGAWLIVNGFAYLAISFTSLLWPQYGTLVYRVSMPVLLGELAIMFWLLIKGIKVRSSATLERAVAAT